MRDAGGCGPEAWSRFFRPPRHVFFEASCKMHDEGYENKKGGGILRKLECDVKFYGAMIGDVNEFSKRPAIDFAWATGYFAFVIVFGWLFFEWKWKKKLRNLYYKYKNKYNER